MPLLYMYLSNSRACSVSRVSSLQITSTKKNKCDLVPCYQTIHIAVHASRREDAALRAIVDAMAQDTGPVAFIRQQRAIMTRADSRPLLPTICCPTLVLVGDSDTVTPPGEAMEMATGIAQATLVVVPDCGHLATIERPAAVNAALAAWLAA